MAKSIKNILISQNAPADMEQSQYKLLMDKYNLKLTFNKFFEVVKISNKEYRAQRINLLDYTAVIMTSKMAVDHYFHFAKEMRLVIPDDMKFFCITDSIANYLQTYIQYRKRKIFYGKLTFDELVDVMKKHSNEKFLFPCAEDASVANFKKLAAANLNYNKIIMHRSQPKKLSDINIKKFDMVVIFSPIGVRSFVENFPGVTSKDICVAAFGSTTHAALKKAGIDISIKAPTTKCPSMIMALDNFFEQERLNGSSKETVKEDDTKKLTVATNKDSSKTKTSNTVTAKTVTKAKTSAKDTLKTEIKTEKVLAKMKETSPKSKSPISETSKTTSKTKTQTTEPTKTAAKSNKPATKSTSKTTSTSVKKESSSKKTSSTATKTTAKSSKATTKATTKKTK